MNITKDIYHVDDDNILMDESNADIIELGMELANIYENFLKDIPRPITHNSSYEGNLENILDIKNYDNEKLIKALIDLSACADTYTFCSGPYSLDRFMPDTAMVWYVYILDELFNRLR